MSTMADKITLHLKDSLNVQNCRKMRNLGRNFHNGDLVKFADDFLCKHITEFCETDEFKNMASDEVIISVIWQCNIREWHSLFGYAITSIKAPFLSAHYAYHVYRGWGMVYPGILVCFTFRLVMCLFFVKIWFQVAELLARDDLYLNNEKDVFDAVIDWISSNSSDRAQKRDLLRWQ